jgi:hypothetical protein
MKGRIIAIPIAFSTVFLLSTCSNTNKDFSKLEKLQSTNEQILQKSNDFDTKIQLCSEVIDTIKTLQAKVKDVNFRESAGNAINLWESRKVNFEIGKRYAELNNYQMTKEPMLHQDYDYQYKSQVCSEVIDSLTTFRQKYQNSQYDSIVVQSIALWESRKSNLIKDWELENSKKARDNNYDDVMRTQQASEQNQNLTNDFDIKMKCCDDAIGAIDKFLGRYPHDGAQPELNTALLSWRDHKAALEQELNSLYQKAYNLNKANASNAAKIQHSMSYINKIDLEKSEKEKRGDKIFVTDIYSIRMVGRILAYNVYNFKVKSVARISMENQTVEVFDPQVIE